MKEICNPEGCRLFYTRADSTPEEFYGLFQAAMLIRELKINERYGKIDELENLLPFWAFEAYTAAERAIRVVEAEYQDDPDGKKAEQNKILNTPVGGAFALIEAQEAARAEKVEIGFAEFIQIFEENPNLDEEVRETLL